MRKILLLLWAVLSLTVEGQAQRVSVGFYNVENLFDTVRSPFYDDSDYTPQGRNRWDTVRYGRKLNNIARVVNDAGFDVLGLAEVENEGVVRDLVQTLADDYNYIHRSTNDSRGIDMAMIYKGDKFFPDAVKQISSGTSRQFLHVRGALIGDTVNILVCHMPSKFNSFKYRVGAMKRLAAVADSLIKNDSAAKLIIMGDFNAEPSEKCFVQAFGRDAYGYYDGSGLYGALLGQAGRGYGSYCWDGKWMLYDNIILSQDLTEESSGLRFDYASVYIRDYMLDGYGEESTTLRIGYPLRTFSSGKYCGGFSDHLPVFVVLEYINDERIE